MAVGEVFGTELILYRLEQRAQAAVTQSERLHERAMQIIKEAFLELSKGPITPGQEKAYFGQTGMGMYGSGTPTSGYGDEVINASHGRGRPGGGISWAEGFDYQTHRAADGHRSELHNTAMSTPYAEEWHRATLVWAFRGWEGTSGGKKIHMRERPIARFAIENVVRTEALRTAQEDCLRGILEGRV